MFVTDNIVLLQPLCNKAQFLSGKAKVDLVEKVAGGFAPLNTLGLYIFVSLLVWQRSLISFDFPQNLSQSSTLASLRWWSRKSCPCSGIS